MRTEMRRGRGVTLIMVAGVLAILSALGAGFYTLMVSQNKSAARYADLVRAEILAKGGIEDAIGRLREQAYMKTEDPTDPWYQVDWRQNATRHVSFPARANQTQLVPSGMTRNLSYSRSLSNSAGVDSDRYTLNVTDAGGKININHCDNLGVLLDNLCRVVGAPLVAANLDMIQPARWAAEGASAADYGQNTTDTSLSLDIYHVIDSGNGTDAISGLKTRNADGTAIYGDGYAIAAYRSRNGLYSSIFDVKFALTVVKNPAHPELEMLEREIKFNAIRDYITVDSWVDTSTVCVGKFEWVNSNGTSKYYNQAMSYTDPNSASTNGANQNTSLPLKNSPLQIFIDRDKSWMADDPKNDPTNKRGSLRGCYVSIMNGHGAGQLRRIATNGIDWIAVEMTSKMVIEPGPISSYMIIAREDAPTDATTTKYGTVSFPRTDANGVLIDDPNTDYTARPLCIHRAPININTASDKVLEAMFLGINVSHGHPMAVGTDADLDKTAAVWMIKPDPHNREDYILTPRGLKRVPISSGKPVLNRPKPWIDTVDFDYIANFGALGSPNFYATSGTPFPCNEVHELAYRIIMARQRSLDPTTGLPLTAKTRDPDPTTADAASGFAGYERGPFRSWDDLYFRVVKPWDDIRSYPTTLAAPNSGSKAMTGQGRESVARMIMAHFNSNTDILKFNPNIEWIDRWGTNFTSMEPVMVYTDMPESPQPFQGTTSMGHSNPTLANPVDNNSIPIFAVEQIPGTNKGLIVPGEENNHQGSYITRSFRYKSDEMIDKTDLNRSTTEFSFDSNGIYEITSIGQVISAADGEVHSERRVDTLIKVYDVWRESTQRQFVNGTISQAANQRLAFNAAADGDHTGTIARDSVNVNTRLALTTQPEPLVPIHYSLNTGGKNVELMDSVFRDAYGNSRKNPYSGSGDPSDVPDILANRVLPSGYDGQIVLATNTLSYDQSPGGDADTFLASYNGDLDTPTCRGNGREQAKTPNDHTVRVVDTIGLLGLLNDTQIDTDVALTGIPGTTTGHSTCFTYAFQNVTNAMDGLIIAPLGNGRTPYWQNAMVRMGDLRTDGVFISGPGIAGNDATLKYVVGQKGLQFSATEVNNAKESQGHANLQINATQTGTTISMWAKPAWHNNDNRTHEFLNTSNPGTGSRAEAFYIVKDGRVKWCNLYSGSGAANVLNGNSTFGISDAGSRNNDFGIAFEGRNTQGVGDWSDPDTVVYLQGGITGVPPQRLDLEHVRWNTPYNPESASFRIQPFRWHYLGVRINYLVGNPAYAQQHQPPRPDSIEPGAAQNKEGYLSGNYSSETLSNNVDTAALAGYFLRPFIDTERYPEQLNFVPANNPSIGQVPNTLKRKYWSVFQWQGAVPWASRDAHGDWYDYEYGHSGEFDSQGGIGQPIAWSWADGGGAVSSAERVFGMDNLNRDQNIQIYRHIMEDGTYSVIDEFKISAKTDMLGDPTQNDRVIREQTTSRYYLPTNPTSRSLTSDACPYFTSQTMYQSLKGNGSTNVTPESVTVARVTWTVFTPRFMHENKVTNGFRRIFHNPQSGVMVYGQNVTDDATSFPNALSKTQIIDVPFKGPFDYDVYNDDDLSIGALGEMVFNGRKNRWASVNRPFPYEYPSGQAHATQGVEIELLNDYTEIAGAAESHRGWGDFQNTSTFTNPDVENRLGTLANPAVIPTNKLRYRVRFVYPVDPLIDPTGGTTVNPAKQYMLDTPVFDDVSITYFSKPQILTYRLVNE